MKIVFLGTPDLATPFLEALTNEPGFEVVAVVTQPDRPVGRKQILTPSPVKELAVSKNLQILQPEKLRDEEVQKQLAEIQADIFVVVAYGLIIPQKVLSLPRLGCLNVHPSLLPKYRGPSPIQSAIMNGDAESGISIMLLDKGMDTGPVLAQEKFLLALDESQISLTEKTKQLGPELLIETIKKYAAGEIKPILQDDTQAVICKILNRESGHIDWSHSAKEIDRLVRALQPWPGCWTTFDHNGKNLRLKILKTKIEEEKLVILEVQPEGRSSMSYEEFERGYGKVKME
ncbi:TPA: methionyl-tRNA formyltransferase [Candidatus Uhrbacteria bacterium]|nr:methionyl-tRNA formyltransferase [Candidatus Uhrbacteria bacterium]HCU31574.1 methionyl-tRNA formyltransferase [Candidatus Uhrbacteria bacterium]